MTVVGARPQFIKTAGVSYRLRERRAVREILVHTGQHYDENMSETFFRELELPAADHHLGVHGGGHGDMTGRMLIALETLMTAEKPDWVLVYGDTNSTLAGALAAAKLGIPVAHVEAGLRSFEPHMPEEINRVLADRVSRLLFCPTATAVANLRAEGIVEGVHHTGDVMYDVLLRYLGKARSGSTLGRFGLSRQSYSLASVHRASNTDDGERLSRIFAFLQRQSLEVPIVLPLHPRTGLALAKAGIEPTGIRIIEPVGYLDMLALLDGAREIYTDSGGLQKEAYFLRKPCVTLREETEWPETIAAGWNKLWTEPGYLERRDIPDFGDGRAGSRICDLLLAAMAA